MKTNLYVDDVRQKPGVDWLLARTIDEAKYALNNLEIEIMSLDYDMGYKENTTIEITIMELLRWMKEQSIWPNKGFIIHTANPAGRDNIKNFIEQYSPVPILEIKYF